MANFYTALLVGILTVSVSAERVKVSEEIAPDPEPASLLAGEHNATHNEASQPSTCSNDVTNADHNTLGTCAVFDCDIKKRGYGVVCDNVPGLFSPSTCVCARGWCAENVNPKKTGDSSTGKCVPCAGVTEVGFEEVLKYGATPAEREAGKAKRVSKKVGKCAHFHCSSSRAPENPEGGGVGCNAADETCYCLQENYFAYDPKFDRTKGLESAAAWTNGDAKCVHISKIPALR